MGVNGTEERARRWAKWIAIVGGALVGLIGPALTAYQFAASEARQAAAKVAASTVDLAVQTKSDSQVTKNEAEAGYQVLLREVEALRAEKAARDRAKPAHRHRARPAAPKALPTDLKKAEQAVSAGSAAPLPPTPSMPANIAGGMGRAGNPDAGP
jgi:hypothetical protein